MTSSITTQISKALTMHLFNGKNGRSHYCMNGRKPWVDMDCRPITYRRCQQFMLIVAAHNVALKHYRRHGERNCRYRSFLLTPLNRRNKKFQNMETLYSRFTGIEPVRCFVVHTHFVNAIDIIFCCVSNYRYLF